VWHGEYWLVESAQGVWMDNGLMEINQIARNNYGVDISKYDETFLMQIVGKRIAATETKNMPDYFRFMLENPEETSTLLGSMNITYTEFFRNPLTFAHLEQWILPSLLEAKSENNELRIWSAGCSSGQEAYSIAILIENMYACRSKKCRYRIIATDISESALMQARKAEYNEVDIQKIRIKDLNDFFVRVGENYTVCDRLKQHVGFYTYDLLDQRSSYPQESIFGNFDLVVCSNLLFYYKPEYQRVIVNKLMNSMDKQGFLLVGEAERQIFKRFKGLYQVVPPSPIYKQRRGVQ
jgi:chemotaxis protein methyltransferase CheR